MATKLISLIPGLPIEQIQEMIENEINQQNFITQSAVDLAIQTAIDPVQIELQNHKTANNPHAITATMINAAPISHTHTASAITSGQLPIANGGTGASTALQARINLGINYQNLGVNVHDLAKTAFGIDDYGNPQNYFEIGGHLHDERYALRNVQTPQAPQLNSGWSNYGGSYPYGLRIWSNFCLFQGLVIRSANASNVICTLPQAQRPKIQKLFITWGYVGNAYALFRIDIAQDGTVNVMFPITTAAISFISLDPLMWIAG